MKYQRSFPLLSLLLVFLLLLGTNVNLVRSQSRRLPPPTGNEKKHKRPGETKPDEKYDEPVPSAMQPTKPQDSEKLSITTQGLNVDSVVYHKKTGQIVTNLKK